MLFSQILEGDMGSQKSRDDEIYEEGVHDGQRADFLDQATHSLTKGYSLNPRENEIYNKGYEYGVAYKPVPAVDRPRSSERPRQYSSETTYVGASSSSDNGCAQVIGWIVGVVIVVAAIVWLAVNIVLPIVLLNSALILTVSTMFYKPRKTLLAWLALIGGCYMILDITYGWFSINFVNKIVKDPTWLTGFVYINAAAVGVSTWLLIRPPWLRATADRTFVKRQEILVHAAFVILLCVPTVLVLVSYYGLGNPFRDAQLVLSGRDAGNDRSAAISQSGAGATTALPGGASTTGYAEPRGHARIGGWSVPEDLAFLSERRIAAQEVESLGKVDLRRLRNFIYARHGRAFAKKDLRRFFEQQPWYRVDAGYSESRLSAVERANITTIAKVESAGSR